VGGSIGAVSDDPQEAGWQGKLGTGKSITGEFGSEEGCPARGVPVDPEQEVVDPEQAGAGLGVAWHQLEQGEGSQQGEEGRRGGGRRGRG
jgi:hypothetical protein